MSSQHPMLNHADSSNAQLINKQKFSKIRPMTGKSPAISTSFAGPFKKQDSGFVNSNAGVEYTPMGIIAGGSSHTPG